MEPEFGIVLVSFSKGVSMKFRNLFILFLLLCVFLFGCGTEQSNPVTNPTEPEETKTAVDQGQVIILFTGRLGNVFARDEAQGQLGYAALAAFREELEAEHPVLLVDGGGSLGGTEWEEDLLEIQDAVGYDVLVPGMLEMDRTLEAPYISCNLPDSGLMPYEIFEVGEKRVAFVGISAGQIQNGQDLYDAVQQAIDDAAHEGADYVIAVSNLGTDPEDSPCTAVEVMTHTTGLVAWLECGSGSVIEGTLVTDKDDFEIPVCAVGSDFCYVGQVTLDLNQGQVKVALIQELTKESNSVKLLAEDLLEKMEPEPETTEATEATTEATVNETE